MNKFNPVAYSKAENRFLLEHVGKPPIVALQALPTPGVNPKAVKPVLERVYELLELEKHTGAQWSGVDAVKAAIQTYLDVDAKWAAGARRGKPRFPSIYAFDSRGKGHRYGPGSDSGFPKTYFNDQGQRVPFAIELVKVEDEFGDEPYLDPTPAEEPKGLIVDAENRRLECGICAFTQSFNPDSRASFNAARARMSKHLRTATTDAEAHRELHTMEFGG